MVVSRRIRLIRHFIPPTTTSVGAANNVILLFDHSIASIRIAQLCRSFLSCCSRLQLQRMGMHFVIANGTGAHHSREKYISATGKDRYPSFSLLDCQQDYRHCHASNHKHLYNERSRRIALMVSRASSSFFSATLTSPALSAWTRPVIVSIGFMVVKSPDIFTSDSHAHVVSFEGFLDLEKVGRSLARGKIQFPIDNVGILRTATVQVG
mmetsp:Transcript_48491/g.134926  ORF Transcript_48491/g.134926 Transcript_48491/m.134926 type:complete len:209 (-) Transcript_48491:290-916(-)